MIPLNATSAEAEGARDMVVPETTMADPGTRV